MKTELNEKFYRQIKFSDLAPETLDAKPIDTPKSNVVYIDYIPSTGKSPSLTYDEFMKEYQRLHAACPKCGATGHSSTYVAYVANMSNTAAYKDKNHCVCSECGDRHLTHDRVPVKQ